MQQRVQTDATCNIDPTILGVVGQKCCVRLHAALRTNSDWRYRYPPGPPGVCLTQSPRKSALFGPVQGCVYKHLSAPGLTLEKISVSRREAQPFGKFTSAERAENSL